MMRVALFTLALLWPFAARAHVPYEDPWVWTFDPWGLLPLGLVATLYTLGLVRLWRRAGAGRGVPIHRVALFGAGIIVAGLAVASPVDALADMLFSLHMVQHLLLMLVAAPLIVLGRPSPVLLFALPRAQRGPVGRLGKGAAGAVWRTLTHPLGAAGLYLITLWVWHVPALYEGAIRSDPVHTLQHANFLFAAVCLWVSVCDRPRRSGHFGASVLSVFATAAHSGALGALLALSAGVWYPFYVERGAGLAPLTDQQVGGLVMWVPSGIILAGAGLVSFAAWLSLAGRRAEQRSALRRAAPLSVVILGALLLTACKPSEEDRAAHRLIHVYGCGTCHVIPRVPGANGRTGPALVDMARQAYVAGVLPNRPDTLALFIADPVGVDPRTAMPDLDMSAGDAAIMAEYLYRVGGGE